MKQFFFGIFVSALIFSLMVAAYFFGKGEVGTKGATPTPSPVANMETITPTEPTIAPATPTPDPAPIIQNAITTKTHSSLLPLMAESVSLRIESSGCCQPQTPQGAVDQLAYLNSATGPWVFSATDPIIQQLATKSPEYWGTGKIVGISPDKYGVSFGVDASGKINAISMVVNYDLILNQ